MNKLSFLILSSFFLVLSSCEKKSGESQTVENQAVDSAQIETVSLEEPEAQLSGKASMVAKIWKALIFETPTAKLTSDLVDIKFNFKENGEFDYSEDGKKENGSWKVNEEGTMILLEYKDGKKADYTITELKEDKMILTGKVHGMYRTYVLAPK